MVTANKSAFSDGPVHKLHPRVDFVRLEHTGINWFTIYERPKLVLLIGGQGRQRPHVNGHLPGTGVPENG